MCFLKILLTILDLVHIINSVFYLFAKVQQYMHFCKMKKWKILWHLQICIKLLYLTNDRIIMIQNYEMIYRTILYTTYKICTLKVNSITLKMASNIGRSLANNTSNFAPNKCWLRTENKTPVTKHREASKNENTNLAVTTTVL